MEIGVAVRSNLRTPPFGSKRRVDTHPGPEVVGLSTTLPMITDRACSSRPTVTPSGDEDADECLSVLQRLNADDTELPEVEQAPTSWDCFEYHIRCIATADPREQYLKKKCTEKASDTYRATIQEMHRNTDQGLDEGDLDVGSKDDSVPRHTPIEASRKNWRTIKDIVLESEGRVTSATGGWRMTSAAKKERHEIRPQLQQPPEDDDEEQKKQQQWRNLDEYARRRRLLYDKYLERQDAWADGLTKCGKEILLSIKKNKRSTRYPVLPVSGSRPRFVRSTTWSPDVAVIKMLIT